MVSSLIISIITVIFVILVLAFPSFLHIFVGLYLLIIGAIGILSVFFLIKSPSKSF